MKFVLCCLVLLGIGYSRNASKTKIKGVFDRLLQKEELTMTGEVYEYRLAAFTLNYWALHKDEKVSIELMYDDDEVRQQNGARMVEDLAVDEELQELSESLLLAKRNAIPRFYNGYTKIINEVVSQGQCGNCFIHTFTTALELAYAKATGKKTKFSTQELTDCYNDGCSGGDYRMLAMHMSYIDKLSKKDEYGSYLSGQFTCRAESTPDALKEIKVMNYVMVSPDTVEAAILQYGSVMACMAWGNKPGDDCYMKTYKKGVYDGPEVEGGCDHAVLIVGYGPGYYIVRNSHGKTWGHNGYFAIKSGTNACGIEEMMAALVIETRKADEMKELTLENGCPVDKPKLCEDVNICTKEETCQRAISKRNAEEFKRAKRESAIERNRQKVKRSSDDDDEIVLYAKRCADKMAQCKNLARYRDVCVAPYLRFCQDTCGKCADENEKPIEDTKESQGKCFKPSIKNGRVMNSNDLLNPGEELVVRCNEGYTLTGGRAKCLIQDVFTNDIKDARLMPECVKLGSNTLKGNGASYTGNKNTYKVGTVTYECDSWNHDVLRGLLANNKNALDLKLGNHNYCRNPAGVEPVPFCIGHESGVGKIHYCFNHPGCETCEGATDDYGPECLQWAAQGRCLYTEKKSAAQVSSVQNRCRATCCKAAGC